MGECDHEPMSIPLSGEVDCRKCGEVLFEPREKSVTVTPKELEWVLELQLPIMRGACVAFPDWISAERANEILQMVYEVQ